MFIGHFTEQPWQDPKQGYLGTIRLDISNKSYDPEVGRQLYNRYLDEKLYAEEIGFDGLMFNEHHSTAFCMQGVTNVGVAILARQTKRAKLCILGNVLPIWDDPLWLAEQLAMIDMISHGRLVSGWVRGAPSESVAHNAPSAYNRERYEEAHDFIVKTWTTPGPFRWEGKHYQYRYVNPWSMPFQRPHPPAMIPGVASKETVRWAAQHHYPYVMLATLLGPTKEMFDYYFECAQEFGYKAGSQNLGYLFKVHADETEAKADEVGRRYISGVENPFISGNTAAAPLFTGLPGLSSADSRKRQAALLGARTGGAASTASTFRAPYETQVEQYSIVSGTPKTVLAKLRHVLGLLRPGTLYIWDGDGAMTHDDQMRSFRLMGSEVLPALREMSKEMGLVGPFESNDGTGIGPDIWAKHKQQQAAKV